MIGQGSVPETIIMIHFFINDVSSQDTLYYTDINNVCVPVNYRIYNKEDGKTKNDYFREMLQRIRECESV